MRRALAGDLAPRAHTTLLAKDSRLALEMAASRRVEAPARTRAPPRRSPRPSRAGYGALDDALRCSTTFAPPSAGSPDATSPAALRRRRPGCCAILAFHSAGPVSCTDVPLASTATVTGMSLTSNS